jgi:hypothetical protein
MLFPCRELSGSYRLAAAHLRRFGTHEKLLLAAPFVRAFRLRSANFRAKVHPESAVI